MINILIKECDFELANLYYKKIHNTVLNKYCIFKDQIRVYIFFWYFFSDIHSLKKKKANS